MHHNENISIRFNDHDFLLDVFMYDLLLRKGRTCVIRLFYI